MYILVPADTSTSPDIITQKHFSMGNAFSSLLLLLFGFSWLLFRENEREREEEEEEGDEEEAEEDPEEFSRSAIGSLSYDGDDDRERGGR